MSSLLREVSTVELPKPVVDRTHSHLFKVGLTGLEGMALWVGTQDDTVFRVRDVIVPHQQGIRSDHGLAVTVSGPELHRINIHLYQSQLRLLAQIHSHPTHAYHSEMDNEYAIATTLGAFSLVVPDFARDPFSIERCAVYRLTPSAWWHSSDRPRWAEVKTHKAASIFKVLEG